MGTTPQTCADFRRRGLVEWMLAGMNLSMATQRQEITNVYGEQVDMTANEKLIARSGAILHRHDEIGYCLCYVLSVSLSNLDIVAVTENRCQ